MRYEECEACGASDPKSILMYCSTCLDEIRVQARAEGAAEERTRHQADCERALLEMEESATRREREACAKLAQTAANVYDVKATRQKAFLNLRDAIRTRGGRP